MSFNSLIEQITQHLINNYKDYEQAHVGGADKVVLDATKFFADGNFNRDVVDIIVKATGHAIGYKLAILKKSPAENIERYITGNEQGGRNIYLKFSSLYYDTITAISHQEPFDYTVQDYNEILQEDENLIQPTQTLSTEQPSDEKSFDGGIPKPREPHYVPDIDDSSIHRYLRPRMRFPHFLYENCTPKEVPYLPRNINNTCAYRIRCTAMDYIQKTADQHWFNMRTTSNINAGGYAPI